MADHNNSANKETFSSENSQDRPLGLAGRKTSSRVQNRDQKKRTTSTVAEAYYSFKSHNLPQTTTTTTKCFEMMVESKDTRGSSEHLYSFQTPIKTPLSAT
jgi:hypothetical protein